MENEGDVDGRLTCTTYDPKFDPFPLTVEPDR